MEKERLIRLLQDYRTGAITIKERRELLAFIASDPDGVQTVPVLESMLENNPVAGQPIDNHRWQPILEAILAIDKSEIPLAPVQPLHRITPIRWIPKVAAAVVIISLTIGAWFFMTRHTNPNNITVLSKLNIPAPVSNRATLTLASGQKIYLDSAAQGNLATQGKTLIQLAASQLVYSARGHTTQVLYNTLYNPRGSRVINLVLADGSKIWLNAESSVRYPTAFTGTTRSVEITGEAYFEVSGNTHQPFIVKKGPTEVAVLGTAFNINTYEDEPALRITLVEGSVSVSKGGQRVVLKPGQQAEVTSGIDIKRSVDLESVVAWKNGRFSFQGIGITEVMREISRWYDLDVKYEKTLKEQHFRGGLPRTANAAQVFQMLETTDAVHFRVEGKTVIVSP